MVYRKFEEFYKRKFQDKGVKDRYCNKEKAKNILMEITADEIKDAAKRIPVKACTWDRIPIKAL